MLVRVRLFGVIGEVSLSKMAATSRKIIAKHAKIDEQVVSPSTAPNPPETSIDHSLSPDLSMCTDDNVDQVIASSDQLESEETINSDNDVLSVASSNEGKKISFATMRQTKKIMTKKVTLNNCPHC